MKNKERRIVWVSQLILDSSLYRTTQMEITRSLAKRGYKTTLFAMRSRRAFQFRGSDSKTSQVFDRLVLVPIRFCPLVSTAIYESVTALLAPLFILNLSPDFLVVGTGMSAISSIPSLIVSKFTRTKVILDIRSVPVQNKGSRRGLNQLIFNFSVLTAKKLFSGITIITPMMKKEICAKFHIAPSQVGVWTSGVSTDLFNPEAYRIQGKDLKKKLGLSGRFVIFYHGSISSNRGISETVQAMKLIAKKYPDAVLFLLGSGLFVPEIKSLIEQENLQTSVFLHDAVEYEEVPKFISMSNVCIIPLPDYPYWRFQSPLKLFEYLSMEKTVIVSDLPCHRIILNNKKCGIYLSSTDPEGIANAIEFSIKNKEKLDNWGEKSRDLVLKEYTWDKVAENLQMYLTSLQRITG